MSTQEDLSALSLPKEGFSVLSPVQFVIDLDSKYLYESTLFTYSLQDDNWDREAAVLVVQHKLMGLPDIELQVIVFAPCGVALYKSSVLL